jgi:hypothetical protein
MVRRLVLAAVLGLAGGRLVFSQAALGTAFTYQGRLTDGAGLASGTYDLRFTLFDVATGGSGVGSPVTRDDVTVSKGLFTVSLDFGAAFAGSKRWLQVEVSPHGTNTYTVLSPRQELTPTPNALFSANAATVGGLACADGQVPKWGGSAWGCAADADSGGDITGVTAGPGLIGGGVSGSVSLSVEPSVVQSRVSGTCPVGSSIRVVNLDGTVGCQPDTTGGDWSLTGNSGTNAAQNFIGTTDNQALELRVAGLPALRIEPSASTGTDMAPTVVLGYEGNFLGGLGGPPQGAVVAGGGLKGGLSRPNRVFANFGTVSGGAGNQVTGSGQDATISGGVENTAGGQDSTVGGGAGNSAGANGSTVGGGQSNSASGAQSTVSGGQNNFASGVQSTVSGGRSNVASGFMSTIVGGFQNGASGILSTVGGGQNNQAGGNFSFAAGTSARVRDPFESGDPDGDEGSFVWSDSNAAPFTSTGPSQFLIRAAGGVGINTNSPSPGGLTVAAPGKLTFETTPRQMIDLMGPAYGIGGQGGVVYFRTEPPGGGFSWFMGGTHTDTQNDPGPGGVRQMRLDGAGNLFVRGAVSGGGADFAEMLAGESGLEPGDVLAIGPDGSLVRSSEPGQTTVVGVFSTQPGFLGGAAEGEGHTGKVPLAVVGIVPVKASAENGPIRPGDRLIASATRGHAMRATVEPVVGSVVGKALSALPSGTGLVQMLVLVQ